MNTVVTKAKFVEPDVSSLIMSERLRLVQNGILSKAVLGVAPAKGDLKWQNFLSPDGQYLKNAPDIATSYVVARIRDCGLSLATMNAELAQLGTYTVSMDEVAACLIYANAQGI
jgi:hypothetical protein